MGYNFKMKMKYLKINIFKFEEYSILYIFFIYIYVYLLGYDSPNLTILTFLSESYFHAFKVVWRKIFNNEIKYFPNWKHVENNRSRIQYKNFKFDMTLKNKKGLSGITMSLRNNWHFYFSKSYAIIVIIAYISSDIFSYYFGCLKTYLHLNNT